MKEYNLLKKIDSTEIPKDFDISVFGNRESISVDDFNNLYVYDSERGTGAVFSARAYSEPEHEKPYKLRYKGPRLFEASVERRAVRSIREAIVYPEKSKFIEYLTELLSREYDKVQIQSVRRQERTRIPISIITFTYEPGPRLGHVYVKDYKGKEDIRNKDIMIPIFLSELGLPTAKVIGYDYKKGEFTNRFAFLKEPTSNTNDCVYLGNVGQNVYTSIINELNPKTMISCSEGIIELMVMMELNATGNLKKLREKFGLELEKTDSKKLIKERLLDYLDVEDKNLAEDFKKTYLRLDEIKKYDKGYFCHGDFTPNNIIMGHTLQDYFLIDWELSRKDASISEDLAMFVATTLGARQEDREDIADLVKGSYISSFIKNFNSLSDEKIDEKIFKDDFIIEELKAQLYKIGDQIWTQERFGESDARKFKSQWYLTRFLGLINSSKNPVLKELKAKTIDLLGSAKNVDYLKPVLKSRL